jgi:hypothetical protein
MTHVPLSTILMGDVAVKGHLSAGQRVGAARTAEAARGLFRDGGDAHSAAGISHILVMSLCKEARDLAAQKERSGMLVPGGCEMV